MIKILSDGHGRDIRQLLKENLNNNFHLYSSIKPNGKLCCDVLSSKELEIKNMDDKDFLIIYYGRHK